MNKSFWRINLSYSVHTSLKLQYPYSQPRPSGPDLAFSYPHSWRDSPPLAVLKGECHSRLTAAETSASELSSACCMSTPFEKYVPGDTACNPIFTPSTWSFSILNKMPRLSSWVLNSRSHQIIKIFAIVPVRSSSIGPPLCYFNT